MQHSRLVASAAALQLDTARLRLRRVAEADLELLVAHELDPSIMRFIRDLPTAAEAVAKVHGFRQPWRGQDGEWLPIVIEPLHGGPLLGMLALRIQSIANETVELGYRLHPDHQGKGLAREACERLLDWLFDDQGVHKVVAFCTTTNTRSFRLMHALGMQREGCLRQFSRLDGAWEDEFVYGLLAGDRPPRR